MKKLIASIVFIFISCEPRSYIGKPDPFIEKDKMGNIIFDLIYLENINIEYKNNTSNEDSTFKLITNKDIPEFVLNKYGIDDSTFIKNNRYYMYRTDEYYEIIGSIIDKLESMKIKNDTALSISEDTKELN